MPANPEIWDKSYGRVYETVATFVPYREHIDRLIDLLYLNQASRLVDLGCGPGTLLERASERYDCRMCGIDISQVLLEGAARRLQGKAELVQHDLSLVLPLADASFDRVVSNNVLGFLGNGRFFWNEVARILKPKGRFVVSTMLPGFNPNKIYLEHIKKATARQILKSIVPTLMVGYYNRQITKKATKDQYAGYTGYTKDSLDAIFKDLPLRALSYSLSYAGQNIVVAGERV